MPIVWNIATSKKVYFAHSIDERQALASGQFQSVAPGGAEDAYVAERAADTMQQVMDAKERARLGCPISDTERDMLGVAWIESENDPLPVT